MGNNQHPILLYLSQQTMRNWIKLQDKGHYELWQNMNTNLCFQAHYIDEEIANNHDQLQKYQFRKIHNSHLVSIEFVIKNKDSFLCNQQRNTFVLIQNIISRLSSFQRIFNFQEALYILSCCAAGFNTINSLFGSIQPENDLICFNEKGKVKVWLNQDLSKNQPNQIQKSIHQKLLINDDPSLAKRRNKQYVLQLIKLVQNASKDEFPLTFKQEIRQVFTFFQLQNYIYYFCQNNRIKMLQNVNLSHQQQNNNENNIFNKKDFLVRSNIIKSADMHLGQSRDNIHKSNGHVNQYLETSRVKHIFASNFNAHPEPVSSKTLTYPQPLSLNSIPAHPNQFLSITKVQPTFETIKRQQPRISLQIKPSYNQKQTQLQPQQPLRLQQSQQPHQPQQPSLLVNKRVSNSTIPSINFNIIPNTRIIHKTVNQQPPAVIQSHNNTQKNNKARQQIATDKQLNQLQQCQRKDSLIQILQNSNYYHNNNNNEPAPQYGLNQQVPIKHKQQRVEDLQSSYEEPYQQYQQQINKSLQPKQQYVQIYKRQQQITNDENNNYESQMLKYQSKIINKKQKQQPIHHNIIEEAQIQQSPHKSHQIHQWQSKLNNFTLSQSKAKPPRYEQNSKQQQIQFFQNKNTKYQQNKSKKDIWRNDNKVLQLKKIDTSPQYNNEMANLQIDDIQAYIRIKYQIYKQQQTTNQHQNLTQNNTSAVFTYNQPIAESEHLYGKQYQQQHNYTTNNDYNKQSSYKPQNQNNYKSSLNKYHYTFNQSSSQPIDNYMTKFNKENQYPVDSYDQQPQIYHDHHLTNSYSKNNHHFNYGSGYNYKDAIQEQSDQHIYSKKNYSKNRNSNNKLASFDQKYSKYVGRGQRNSYGKAEKKHEKGMNSPKHHLTYENRYEFDKNDSKRVSKQQVSLILNNEDSKISRLAKQSRYNNVQQSSNSYKQPKQLSKQLSYKNLRNFLWAQ